MRDALVRALRSRWLRVVFVLVALVLGGITVANRWQDVRPVLDRLDPWWLVASFLAAALALIASAAMWRSLLADLGSRLPARAAGRVFLVSQLGKYLPGSVWPVLAQMELARDHDVPRTRAATASILVMVVNLASGLFVAAVTIPVFAGDVADRYRWLLLLAPVIVAFLYPRVLNPILARVLRLARRPAMEKPLRLRDVARAFGWSLAAWLAYGLHTWLLVLGIGTTTWRALPLAVGGFALAFCAGFLVVIVPAGAGVRDVALAAALSPVLGSGGAIVVSLASRLLLVIADLTLAGAAAATGKRPSRTKDTPAKN
ncbi:MAG TPA: lysylphosphatidylglycerol synthase transmembrane domain-containing protein [Streptosporangiaceae bacterium]